jgi:hypothetical protein
MTNGSLRWGTIRARISAPRVPDLLVRNELDPGRWPIQMPVLRKAVQLALGVGFGAVARPDEDKDARCVRHGRVGL